MNELSRSELYNLLNSVLTFQFDEQFASLFLQPFTEMQFKFSSKTGRLRYIYYKNQIQGTYRPQLGTFSISIEAVKRIIVSLPFPNFRVQVQNDVSEFIKQGKSVFSKHVKLADSNLCIGDEVIVVDEQDHILAVGKLEIPFQYLSYMKSGSAVHVRKGNEKNDED